MKNKEIKINQEKSKKSVKSNESFKENKNPELKITLNNFNKLFKKL